MKKILLCLFLLQIGLINLKAQAPKRYTIDKFGLYGDDYRRRYFMLSIGGGPAYLFGDIGGQTSVPLLGGADVDPNSTSGTLAIELKHVFPFNLGLKGSYVQGNFSGDDQASSILSHQNRGYNYTTSFKEISIQAEFIFIGGPASIVRNPNTLGAYAGGGYLMYDPILNDPKNNITYRTVEHQFDIINTEPNQAMVMPLGIFYEYNLTHNLTIGANLGMHYVFTDYLDGLSTINSESSETLLNLNFYLGYKLF